ncbi:MAG: hypothetical protein IPO63_08605 [Bacteroidetes bacterium]|nr:hypothetical protein [Bacteroidota bacterium]
MKSSKAASRVMSSITKYIEEDLILQVNHEKSKISGPVKKHPARVLFLQNQESMAN